MAENSNTDRIEVEQLKRLLSQGTVATTPVIVMEIIQGWLARLWVLHRAKVERLHKDGQAASMGKS